MSNKDFTLSCPSPLKNYKQVLLGHGSGGKMMQDLLEHLILPEFTTPKNTVPATDAAVLSLDMFKSKGTQLAFTTDSFVINPPIFPGGDIGSLAVHGTINDLAMMGAMPLFLSVALILEEGFSIKTLQTVIHSLAQAAQKANVRIVTGDTKVVEKGHGDQIYITTTGIGAIASGINLSPTLIHPGDALITNGTVGDHGITIMSLRKGLEFGTKLISDSAPLHELVQTMLMTCPDIHTLRDMTRGGLAAVANELAQSSHTCFEIDEAEVPVSHEVASACELLGLDPFQVANEGKLLAVVPSDKAAMIVRTMKQHPLGKQAAIIGKVKDSPQGIVVGKTIIGSERVIDVPAGELLPRIC